MVLQCQSVGAWLLFAYAVSASPADESAVRGSRTDQGDQALDEKHQDTYGTFASEFYDLRYLSEEGYPFPTAPPVDPFARIRVDDCGKTKGCFRYGKPGCNAETCDYFLSYRRIGADVEFELSADTEGWVAVGFSSDKKMGGDDVMACVHDDNGRVRIQHFYNVGQWAKEIKRNPARDEEGVFENNRVTCRFKRPVYVPRDETIVDLHLSWYYLFAWGPAIQGTEKHTLQVVSPEENGEPILQDMALIVEQVTGVPLNSQKLICKGKSLKEMEQTLSVLGVKNGCRVMLIGKRNSTEEESELKKLKDLEKSVELMTTKLEDVNKELLRIQKGFLNKSLQAETLIKLDKRIKTTMEQFMKILEQIDSMKVAELKGSKANISSPSNKVQLHHIMKRKGSEPENQESKRIKGTEDQPTALKTKLPEGFFETEETSSAKHAAEKAPSLKLLAGDYEDDDEVEGEEYENVNEASTSLQKPAEIPLPPPTSSADRLPAGKTIQLRLCLRDFLMTQKLMQRLEKLMLPKTRWIKNGKNSKKKLGKLIVFLMQLSQKRMRKAGWIVRLMKLMSKLNVTVELSI
uniref:Zinc finger protein 830 n=1 Tax=Xenopus tropicalis TaxID=8364 RepID=A0A803JFR7_XENTR